MQAWQILTITLAAVAIVFIAWTVHNQGVRRRLKEHFGPEYDRTVAELGNQRRAESELARREAHVRNLHIRPLSGAEHEQFSEQWKLCQARFVDDPAGAVKEADDLVTEIMQVRGYTVSSREDRFADISAAYPAHTPDYRLAEGIVGRLDEASTEDLRNSFVRYRALFDEMLGDKPEHLRRAS